MIKNQSVLHVQPYLMNNNGGETMHLPDDPKKWVDDLEKIWQEKNCDKASIGYTEDAIFIFGCEQKQNYNDLILRPKEWFEYAKDLKIKKSI